MLGFVGLLGFVWICVGGAKGSFHSEVEGGRCSLTLCLHLVPEVDSGDRGCVVCVQRALHAPYSGNPVTQ